MSEPRFVASLVCIILIIISLCVLAGIVCQTKPDGPKKFRVGDFCVVETTGERVAVVCVWRYKYLHTNLHWRYKCRVGSAGQRRRDGVVSADTEIVAYTLVDFYGFELREEAGR